MYKRGMILFAALAGMFVILMGRIAILPYLDDSRAVSAAQLQQNTRLTIGEKRGVIYDRDLQPITYRDREYHAVVMPAQCENKGEHIGLLANESALTVAELQQKFASQSPFVVTTESKLEQCDCIRGFEVEKDDAAYRLLHHVVGDLDSKGEVGKSGLLLGFDEFLKERGGELYAEVPVNAVRQQLTGLLPSFEEQNYYQKNGLALTVDAEIQEIAEEAAASIERGAVVVSEVHTGDLIALVSRPDYDGTKIADYLESENAELLNRCYQSYNIGSIWKLMVLASYLEDEGKLPEFTTYCPGYVDVGGQRFACHKETGHGPVDCKTAVEQSCNVYFISLMLSEMKLERVIDLAARFGVGEGWYLAPGNIVQEGRLPTNYRRPTLALIANTAIGQGDVMMTPVDVAYFIGAIANEGFACEPGLVRGEVKEGELVPFASDRSKKKLLSKKTCELLCELMIGTVESGTGKPAQPEMGGAGGKTASAETGMREDGEQVVHGWFAGFYPAEQPQYVIVVLAENGRSGSRSAAPVFQQIADGIAGLTNR